MTKRHPVRRTVAVAIAATVLSVASLAAAGPAGALSDTGRHAGHEHEHTDAEHYGQQRLPAPPRPSTAVPSERVVLTGQTPTRKITRTAPRTSTVATGMTTESAAAPTAALTTMMATAAVPTMKVNSGAAAPGGGTAKTLVLYDNTGPYSWLGEVYGMTAANLVSHFGSWTAHPVGGYTAGEMAGYTAVVYVGSTYDEPLPVAFLDDTLAGSTPVLWMYDNIWQLTARSADFTTKYGYTWRGFDFSPISQVNYRGTSLTRDAQNGGGMMDYLVTDPTKVTSVGEAVRADGTTLPWGVKSANLTYLGEIPFSYVTADDRYMGFADLLYDVLAPATAERHRALVRIEDVGPDADPAELRAVADYLYSKRVPFTVAVYPRYRNPRGVDNGGRAEDYTLRQRPLVVSALKYMQARGGTLLMHGYTHQLNSLLNPYDGVSANDFEFYMAHVDAQDYVRYDGPVAGDSATFVNGRIAAAHAEFLMAGLKMPTIFEFPHYAGSATDYKAINSLFGKRYDRGLYFPGVFSGGTVDHSKLTGQFFPYAVRDVYGSAIVPENIGNIEPEAFNNHPAKLPADLIASAKRNLVVRDGTASFFYHPYLGTAHLKATVEGIQALGYTFVPASAML